MESIYTLDKVITAIVGFGPELGRPMCHKVLYQVRMDPENLSPSGDFIRFNQFEEIEGERKTVNEIHGWKAVDEITIFEILEEEAVMSGKNNNLQAANFQVGKVANG